MATQQAWCRPGLGSPRAGAVLFLIPFVGEHCFQVIFTELKKKKFFVKHTQKCVRHMRRAPCTMGSEHICVTLLSSRRKMEPAARALSWLDTVPQPRLLWRPGALPPTWSPVRTDWPCPLSPQARRVCCGCWASPAPRAHEFLLPRGSCGWFPVPGLRVVSGSGAARGGLYVFAFPESVRREAGPRGHPAGATPGSGGAEPVSTGSFPLPRAAAHAGGRGCDACSKI